MSTAKFFDGQSAQSQKVILRIESKNLLILSETSGEQLDSWPIKDLRLDPRIPTVSVLMCKYEPDARIELIDHQILESLKKHNSLLHKKTLSRRKLGILVVLFIFILIAVFFGVQFFSAQLAHRIPFSIEQKLAKKLEIEKEFGLCPLSPVQSTVLDKLVSSVYPALPQDSEFSIKVQVYREKVANAFTLPGGNILFTEELLNQADSPEEIVGVLAHELGHVEHRHILQSIIRSTLLVTFVNFISYGPAGMILIDPGTAAQLLLLKYSRGMEEEADQSSLLRLHHQHIDLRGYQKFFTRENLQTSDALGFLSTHPASPERARLIEKNILPNQITTPVLSAEEFQILKGICKNTEPGP